MSKISRDITKIPNLLCILRLLLIPVFIHLFMLKGSFTYWSVGVLALSFTTDAYDGYYARKHDQITELGRILDPLADKATQVAITFVLYRTEYISIYVFLIFFIKEATMGIGALYLKKKIKTDMIASNIWGKAATGGFYLSVALIIIVDAPQGLGIWFLYITVCLTLVAFYTYCKEVFDMRKHMRSEK